MQHTKAIIDQQAERDKHTKLIINSSAQKKIIVAGPGTGKTTTFQKVLAQSGLKNNLVLTFINRLVNDLNCKLNQYANISTMHKFCIGIFHKQFPDWHLVGSLDKIIGEDTGVKYERFNKVFHKLDESNSLFKLFLKRSNYYKSVGFNDSVYRVMKKSVLTPSIIPDYENILIDEFQDFSALEAAFIKLLETHGRILIVGDDDQAIYLKKFDLGKSLRSLYKSGVYDQFELPFCSRCPKVIVESVNDIVNNAVKNGNLKGRIPKKFVAYEKDKESVNENYPKLKVFEMSTLKAAAQFINYSAECILKRELTKYQERKSTDSLILIIGKTQYLKYFRKNLTTVAEYIEPETKSNRQMDICRAYEILMKNKSANIGWRLLMYYDNVTRQKKYKDLISRTFDDTPLIKLLPNEYKQHHMSVVQQIDKLLNSPGTDSLIYEQQLEELVGLELKEIIIKYFTGKCTDGSADSSVTQYPIIITSFQGSKGLSADYVYIVGLNNEALPKDPNNIKDPEICELIVGLTRTKKECYVMPFRYISKHKYCGSTFLSWISSKRIDYIYLNSLDVKNRFKENKG